MIKYSHLQNTTARKIGSKYRISKSLFQYFSHVMKQLWFYLKKIYQFSKQKQKLSIQFSISIHNINSQKRNLTVISQISLIAKETLKLKACVRYFSLFLREQYVSWLFRTKYVEIKFNLQLLYLPIVSRTFILSWATTRCPPS